MLLPRSHGLRELTAERMLARAKANRAEFQGFDL
jgi:hypothetical protein